MAEDIRIGAGGWLYFNIPGRDPLREYSKIFDFVEVNSTFYRKIDLRIVEGWRRRVPTSFIFSIRVPRTVTHVYRLEPSKKVLYDLEYITEVADILRSRFLVMETPPSLKITREKLSRFMNKIDIGDKSIALEVRGKVERDALEFMKENNIIFITDLSKEEPPYPEEICYTRIFGKGRANVYQFTDKELDVIYRKAKNAPVKQVLMSFHGVRMYTDAGRLRYYHLYGGFPENKPPYGLEAVRKELLLDMRFPATKEDLVRHEGWKVVPVSKNENVHLGDMLSWLPPKLYMDVDSVINELEKVFK